MVSAGTKRRHAADRTGTKDTATKSKYKTVYCLFPTSMFGAFPYVKNRIKSSLSETGGGALHAQVCDQKGGLQIV